MAEDHDKAERQYLPSWSSDRSLSSWDVYGLHCKMYAPGSRSWGAARAAAINRAGARVWR